jgi:hypothetical protein
MSNAEDYFGEIVEEDIIAGDDNVEKRFALKGRNVRFFVNLIFLCEHHIKSNGYKAVKENILFQEIFDVVVSKTYDHSYIYRIGLGVNNPGKAFQIDMSKYESIEDFCTRAEKLQHKLSKVGAGTAPQRKLVKEENLDDVISEEETEAQTDALVQDGQKESETKEDALAALEREINEGSNSV